MQQPIYLLIYLVMLHANPTQDGNVRICGVSLSYHQSSIFLCNDSNMDVDVSRFLLSAHKRSRKNSSIRLADSTIIKGQSDLEIPIPFLDIPYNILGGEKFKRFYLFDKETHLVSKFKSRNRD
jgi:hypothetical protein